MHLSLLQYIPRNMHTVFALLCFVVVIDWLIFPYPLGLLHWHCGNLTIAPVPAKQPWWIWINTSCEFIMNDCITTTKQSTTKPCACFLGYTVFAKWRPFMSKGRCVKYFLFSSIFKIFVSVFQNDVVWISSAEELENKFSQLRQPLISARIFPTKSQRQEYPYFQQAGCNPGCPARIVDHNVPLEERSSCPFNFTHNVDPTRYPHTLLMAVCCKGQCARVGGHRHHQQQHSCQPLMQQVQVLRREHPQILNTAAGYYKVVAETVPVACLCAPANRGE